MELRKITLQYLFIFILFCTFISPCFTTADIVGNSSDFKYFLVPQTILTPFNPFRIAVTAQSPPLSDLTHRFDFSIIDLKTNSEVSARTITILPNSTFREDVTLPVSKVYYNPHILQIQLFSFSNQLDNQTGFHNFSLLNVTQLKLSPDLRRTHISIHTGASSEIKEGDDVPFTILFLDTSLKPLRENKSVNIYLWSSSSSHGHNVLRKNWTSQVVTPDNPYLSGMFQVPRNETSRNTTRFYLSVVVDERMPEDTYDLKLSSIREELYYSFAEGYVFYSFQIKGFQLVRRNELDERRDTKVLQPLLVEATAVTHTTVSYSSPSTVLKIKTTNIHGYPVVDGECSITETQINWEHKSNCSFTQKLSFPLKPGQRETSFEVNLLGAAASSNCSVSDLFGAFNALLVELKIECIDRVTLQKGWTKVGTLTIAQNEYLFPYLVTPTVEDPKSLIIQVITKEGYAYNSTDLEERLQIDYVFGDNSTRSYQEPIGYNGIVEHDIRHKNESSNPLIMMRLSFRNSTKEVRSLGVIPQYGILPERNLFVVGHPLTIPLEHRVFVESGKDIEFMFFATNPNQSDIKYLSILSKSYTKDTEIFFQDLTTETHAKSTKNVKFFSLKFPTSASRSRRAIIYASSSFEIGKEKVMEVFFNSFIYDGRLKIKETPGIEWKDGRMTKLKISVPKIGDTLKVVGIHSTSSPLSDADLNDFETNDYISHFRHLGERCKITNFNNSSPINECSYVNAVFHNIKTDSKNVTTYQSPYLLEDDDIIAILHDTRNSTDYISDKAMPVTTTELLKTWKWKVINRTSSTDAVEFDYNISYVDNTFVRFGGLVIDSQKGLGFLKSTDRLPSNRPNLLLAESEIHNGDVPMLELTLINYSNDSLTNLTLSVTDLSNNALFRPSKASNTQDLIDLGPYSYLKPIYPFEVKNCNETSHIEIKVTHSAQSTLQISRSNQIKQLVLFKKCDFLSR